MAASLGAIGLGLGAIRRGLVRVAGDSMAPGLRPGDIAVVVPTGLGPADAGAAVGDVVVVVDPTGREVVKRVSALPGEWTDVMDGPLLVPADHLAVRGDNVARSTDSRHYGPLPQDAVRGRVAAVVSRDAPYVRIFRRGRVQAHR